MDMGNKILLTGMFMSGSIKMENHMEMANMFGKMALCIKEIL